METLEIKISSSTPLVELNSNKNHIKFSGESRPENAATFYAPIFAWLKEYQEHLLKNPGKEVLCEFKLDYFNSSSAKCLLDVLESIREIDSPQNKLTIKWYYIEEDEDMYDAGKEYADILDFNIELIVIS